MRRGAAGVHALGRSPMTPAPSNTTRTPPPKKHKTHLRMLYTMNVLSCCARVASTLAASPPASAAAAGAAAAAAPLLASAVMRLKGERLVRESARFCMVHSMRPALTSRSCRSAAGGGVG